jgi:hypothetical protein
MFSDFFPKNHVVYEITWKNVAEPERPHDKVIERLRFACRITKPRHTHTLRICNTY